MGDTTELLSEVDRLADRLRALPESRLRRGAAAEGLALARELATRAQRREFPHREPAWLPDEGLFAVGDQVAVAGHDLALALEGQPADGTSAEDGDAVEAERADALRLVRETLLRVG
ncbi:hypothetical protein E0L36_00440 [Streptomyces sp. AJS327]|uniref:hypothetical protein n=1 Tax=Streptomyces sp. AJS327 TaxID=2545265 RepID=UPI0015E010FB|nr:hypothetical protein [Streptomyces sp. AJS327]MBA0049435.1 hypothetical protein [Streptomyces sp. AJS327]